MRVTDSKISRLRVGNEPGRIAISQKIMAEKLGVSIPTYGKIENGTVLPDINQVFILLEVFGLELSQLNQLFYLED